MNMEKERCETCRFWLLFRDNGNKFELCRRYPPTGPKLLRGTFPTALGSWWCGEWQEKIPERTSK